MGQNHMDERPRRGRIPCRCIQCARKRRNHDQERHFDRYLSWRLVLHVRVHQRIRGMSRGQNLGQAIHATVGFILAAYILTQEHPPIHPLLNFILKFIIVVGALLMGAIAVVSFKKFISK